MSRKEEPVLIGFDRLVRRSEKAILFEFGDREVWIPKSLILDVDEGTNVLELPRWKAEEEELL